MKRQKVTDQQLLAKQDLLTSNSGMFEHNKQVHSGFCQKQSCSTGPALITNGQHATPLICLFAMVVVSGGVILFAISSSFCFTVINLHHLSHTDVRVRWHDEVSVVYFYLHNEESSAWHSDTSAQPLLDHMAGRWGTWSLTGHWGRG